MINAVRIAGLQALSIALARATSAEEIAHAVAQHSVDALEGSGGCVVGLLRGDTIELHGMRGLADDAAARWRSFPLSTPIPIADAIRDRAPVFLRDADEFRERYGRTPATSDGEVTRATVAVPLEVAGECLGAIGLSFRQARTFEPDEREFIFTIARTAAQAIDRVRQHQASKREAERLAILIDVARTFAASTEDVRLTLDSIAEKFSFIVGDSCLIFLLSDDGRFLDPVVVRHREPEIEALVRSTLGAERRPANVGITGRVLQTGAGVHIPVISREQFRASLLDGYQGWADRFTAYSLIVTPLVAEGAPIGVLVVGRTTEEHPYTASDFELVSTLSDHASLAIERSRVQDRERDRRRRAELLADVTRAVADADDVAAACEVLASKLAPALCERCTVSLVEQSSLDEPAQRDSFERTSFEPAEISVALVAREHVLGTVTVRREADRPPFTVADRAWLEELASHAALVIDNLRLLAEARAAVQLRDQFLSIASHELKTPVAAFSLQLESMRRSLRAKDAEAAAAPWLDRLAKQVRRLTALTDELLDVTRIQTGRVVLDREGLVLGDLVEEVVSREREHTAMPIVLHRTSDARGMWDRARLDQVLTNLIGNAIKYGEGTVNVLVDGTTVVVRDEGKGISPEDQRRIFEPFERGSSAEGKGGFGLGLFIARTLVEAHGGTIRVESPPGSGAAFIVELPS